MFDIGFPELVLISIVALLVIGPHKLPETVRTVSLWVGRLQRSFANIRREIEKEIGADEIRTQLHNESVMADLESAKQSIEEVASEVKRTVDEASQEVNAAKLEGERAGERSEESPNAATGKQGTGGPS